MGKAHQIEYGPHQSLGLAQPQAEDAAQRQNRLDGKVGIFRLATT